MGLPRHRAREERFSRSRRTEQQHPLGDAPAEARVFRRMLQELDDFPQLLRGFVDARHVGKRHLHVVFRVDLGAAAFEGHGALARRHPSQDEAPHQHHQDQRQQPSRQIAPPVRLCLARELHAVLFQLFDEAGILDPRCLERLAPVFECPRDLMLVDHDFGDLARANHLDEVAIGDRLRRRDGQRDEQSDGQRRRQQIEDDENGGRTELRVTTAYGAGPT
jgi:hypothetical protein